MMSPGHRRIPLVAVLAAGVCLPAAGQNAVIKRNVNQVMVDLIVTGPHGRVIKDLKPGQVELFDNSHRRSVTSLRFVSRSVHLPAATVSRLRIPPDLRPQPFNLVVVVFDNITALGRPLARRSALWFLQHDLGPSDYAAVFRAGGGLTALTPVTQDRTLLERAVAAATGGASAPRQTAITAEGELRDARARAEQALGAAQRANMKRAAGHDALESAFAALLAATLGRSAAAANTQSSWSSLSALRALAGALGALPGRKEVIYYSQWLDVNATTVFALRALIRDANRNYVNFYPVDPAGLSVTSSASQVADALEQAAGGGSAPSPFTTTPGEAAEDVTYAGRLSSLSELAGATGGFLSARANDLRGFMAKIAADIHDHYELTYDPGPLPAVRSTRLRSKLPATLTGASALARDTTCCPACPYPSRRR